MSDDPTQHRDTDVQHVGEDREDQLGAVAPPVYRTSLFTFPDSAALEASLTGDDPRFLYSRVSNPTVRLLEEKVAALEKADDGIALASGMAAVSSVLVAHLHAGDHLVISARAYGPTLLFVHEVLEPLGVRVTTLEPEEFSELEPHLREETRLVYLESPSSLTFDVVDLESVAKVCRSRGIPTAVDNSWATPIFQQPVLLGIDLSLHSGTKYLGGHSDIVFGVVAGGAEAVERVRQSAVLLGGCLSPDNASLAVRGLRTLPLRMKRHEESAMTLVRRLLARDDVLEVLHPALPFFPSHALWLRQFSGSSGLFSFRIGGDPRRFCDALEVFQIGVSWGGHESLALPSSVLPEVVPGSGTRSDLPLDLVRLSVGLEDPDDLWKDMERGLASA